MQSKTTKRFGFYVSGNASRLVKTIEQYPEIIANTFIVVNDEAPNSNLVQLLTQRKVEYVEFNYKEKDLKGNEKNNFISYLLLQKFQEYQIDYAFCFGGRILKGELLSVYKNKIINFHPAILPMFPGVKSIDQAINANTFLLGNTAHFVDEGMDTGPVIMQSTIHSKNFVAYEDVLGLQLPMINQIFLWLKEDRITVEDRKVIIKNADYNSVSFYPKLEIHS